MKLSRLRLLTLSVLLVPHIYAQQGATKGEWRFYGGDAGSTKYAPLDQINASNVKQLEIAWRWKAENFGPRPDYNWETKPLMIGGGRSVNAPPPGEEDARPGKAKPVK